MSPTNRIGFAALVVVLVFGLGVALLVWPGYRETRDIARRMDELRDKVQGLDDRTDMVERLVVQLRETQSRVEHDLRDVPDHADIASLFRSLSFPVDGVTVRDQTFAAGNPVAAVSGTGTTMKAMPVTVDMDASFDSIFSLIRASERMQRLVRVSAVQIACDRGQEETGFLRATIDLDAIYEPLEMEAHAQ